MQNSGKILIGGLIILALALGGYFFSSHEKQEEREQSLIIGVQSGYPPFEFVDSNGKVVGFDIDVAGAIAEKLGKKLVVQDMEFEGEILSLKQGKIDLIVSGMNITPSRLKEIDMIPYHGDQTKSLSLLFWNEIPQGADSLEALANMPRVYISVESGSVPEEYATKFPNLRTKSFQGSLAPLMDVKFGKSTANLVQPEVANHLIALHPEIKVVNIPLAPEDQILGFGIGIKKGNEQLYNQVKEIVDNMKQSGEMKKLEEKWFKGGAA